MEHHTLTTFKAHTEAISLSSIILPTIWLALPFPTVSAEERATYIQDTLSSGRPIIAACDVKPFTRTNQHSLESQWFFECTSVLFHWRFARSHHSIQILLAPHDRKSYHDSAFDLARQFDWARVWNERATGRNEAWSPLFFFWRSLASTHHRPCWAGR